MNDLILYWFLFVASSAFIGTLSAVFTAWGIRALYRKVKKWMDE